jgi:HKD family nuclease
MSKNKSTSVRAVLASNSDEGHASVLRMHLAKATRFTCIVAFARMSGFREIAEELNTRVEAGLKATFVVGIDFFQTEPELLNAALKLKKAAKSTDDVKVYMGAESHKVTMHPKVYLFALKGGSTAAVVGSANMTGGGFQTNHEFSAVMSGHEVGWEAELNEWIKAQIDLGEVVEADEDAVERYAVRRAVYLPHMEMAKRRAEKAILMPRGNLDTLRAILAAMRADQGEDGFDVQVARRTEATVRAAAVLRKLARPKVLAAREFLEFYERLASGLWHSGGLHRAKTTIAKKAGRFQSALRALDANASTNPELLFEQLRGFMRYVPKAGVNVMTEILHTRDSTRFPVMNQNSISGMRRAQITSYPKTPSKDSVDGATYARFCADAERIRTELGLANLRELDALFNYAYWGKD